jgi:bifunctional non-homologous end joining protein LigD
MPRVAATRSKRQYVHVHNAPAQRLARSLAAAKGAPMPAYVEPALATLRSTPPKGKYWVHEIKFDGYRFQLHVSPGQVRFFTRRGHDWSARVAKLTAAASRLKTYAAIIDGEVVVHGPQGGTDFNELERELNKKGGSDNLVFYAFDLLYLDGLDLREAALLER